MTKFMPVSARTALLTGQIDVTDGTLSAVLLDEGYVVDGAHDMLDDVAGGYRIATALVSGVSVVDGEVYGSVTFTAVAAGPTCTGLWFFMDTGTAATSRLVAYTDQYGDHRPISSDPIVPNGANVVLTWPANRLFGLGSPVTI